MLPRESSKSSSIADIAGTGADRTASMPIRSQPNITWAESMRRTNNTSPSPGMPEASRGSQCSPAASGRRTRTETGPNSGGISSGAPHRPVATSASRPKQRGN
jgi:hypothetical protein